ncbi:MAG: class I SAM-dependent methyltransferase family protein [Motilibacteraceae bacterium]
MAEPDPPDQPVQPDWFDWHAPYDDPGSPLAGRLRRVQHHVRDWLDTRATTASRVVSMCAGQGRDLLDVLGPRGADLPVRLVEADPRNAEQARALAAAHGLRNAEVVVGDAGRTAAYLGAAPADLVLVCGVLGNIGDDDVRRTVQQLPMLCAPGATVVWTRSRRAPDLTPSIRRWFTTAGFDELSFDAPDDVLWSVGVHRLAAAPQPLDPDGRLFAFAR